MPRATQDADIVVALDLARLDAFIAAATSTYYVPEGLARAAVPQHGMFNVIHSDSAFKIDLVVRRVARPATRRRARRLDSLKRPN